MLQKRPVLTDFNFKEPGKKEESSLSPPLPPCPRARHLRIAPYVVDLRPRSAAIDHRIEP